MRRASNQEAVSNTDFPSIPEGQIDHVVDHHGTPAIYMVQEVDHALTPRNSRQKMRVRRYFLACFFSLLYLFAIAVFHTQGLVDRSVLMTVIMAACVGMVAFFGIFYSGLNKKAAEKNLTAPIIVYGLGLMLWTVYAAPATRIVFTPFVFAIMAFGMYRLAQNVMLRLTMLALVGYASVIALHYVQTDDLAALKYEYLHWFVLGITLPGFVLITGRVQRLHTALLKAGLKIKNIEEHARRDPLTGCYNRRYMIAVLEAQKRLADESGADLCLAVFDLDHFKLVNDEVGHLAGDEVLRTFARIAQDNIRHSDVFGRFGGEEFLLVLPETALQAAMILAERIREQVANHAWSDKLRQPVTVSIGLTQYIPGETVLDLFSRTDTAMYLAKRGGRNQVVVEEPKKGLWQDAEL